MNDEIRERYNTLRRRSADRDTRLLAALREANQSSNYTRYDELKADLNEEAEEDLGHALDLLGRVLGDALVDDDPDRTKDLEGEQL